MTIGLIPRYNNGEDSVAVSEVSSKPYSKEVAQWAMNL